MGSSANSLVLVLFEGVHLGNKSATPGPPDDALAVLEFGGFRLDVGNARLSQGTRTLDLAPKPFAVLCHLASRPGLLVTKDQLLDAVWGQRFVGESVLKTTVNLIRSVLDDDPRQPRFLETVPRRGYRFVGLAPSGEPAAPPASPPTSPPTTPTPHPGPAPLIGREHAIGQLSTWLAAAGAGQRELVLVGGEAGIGKSMLLRHWVEQAQATAGASNQAFAVAMGQCVEQAGGGEPYLPILDALADLARGPAGASWQAALRQAAPTWLAQLPWLVSMADQARLQTDLAGAAQDRMLREFGALLDIVTPTQPLLLVIEDLHWSDHATVSLLDYLARRRGPGRWMLVASYRPTDLALSDHPMQALRHELRLHKLCRELLLEPFTEQEVNAYLQQRLRLAWAPGHEALARALHHHTDGLPLFLANVLDDLESEGLVANGPAAWSGWADPAAELARLQLPDTVVGIIERQIRRLPGDLRDLLEAASVLGQEFSPGLLAQVLGGDADPDPDAQRGRCEGLARRAEWLRSAGMVALPDGTPAARFAFRHALYRRVFYERCAPARRLQLHQRAAGALLAVVGASGSHGDRLAAELAGHYEGARDTAAAAGMAWVATAQDAILWRLRAARAAVAVHAPADALAHYAMAHRAGPQPRDQVSLLSECAALHQQLGAGAMALAQSAAALAAARHIGDPQLTQPVMLQLAQLSQQNDQQHEAIRLVDELLANPTRLAGEQQADALVVKADALDCLGRRQEADAAADAAFSCLPADADAARARHLASRVAALFHRGEFAQGVPLIETALHLYEGLGDAVGAAAMMNRRGIFLIMLGRPLDAEMALLDASARTRVIHDVPEQRRAILNIVKLRTDRGDADSALALLDEGWQLSAGFESPVTECAFLNGFYYCNYLRGQLGLALRDAARVLASAQALSSVFWRVSSLCLVSDLHIHLGNMGLAKTLIEQALAQSHTREVSHLWPQVMGHRAWLDVLAGNASLALARLDEIDAGEGVKAEDTAALARVRAQAWLALGDPQTALATLAPFNGAPTQETWTLMLALRLQAQCLTRAVVQADLDRAHTDLLDRRTPALESLVLRQALVNALHAHGQEDAAVTQRTLLAAHLHQLADSLAGVPDQQARFKHCWGLAGD